MELEQTSELSVFARKEVKPEPVELVPTGPIANSFSRMDDVEYTQDIPTIKHDAQMSDPLSFTPSSAGPLHQRPHRRSGTSSLVVTDDDLPSTENSPELEITNPEYPPTRDHDHPSRRLQITSKYVSTSISPPPPLSMSTSRVRVEVQPFPNQADRTTPKPFPTVRPYPRSSRSPTPNNNNPPVLKKRKAHHSSLDTGTVSPKSVHQVSSSTSSVKASSSRADHDGLFILEYDLDRDPTQQAYEFHDLFHERSPFSAILSARFIHAHLFERLSDSTACSDGLTNSGADLVTEFIEPTALTPVGPQDADTPPYALDSAAMLGDPDPTSTPDYGNLGLEGPVHVIDPFTVLTMDDVINNQPWNPNAETTVDPSMLGGTPAFSEPHSPSPAPTLFRDFPSWKRARTPSPPLIQPALTIRTPSRISTSTSGSNSAQTRGDAEGNLGGGKARFYRKGTLQTPPHLSSSQRRRSVSAKTSESIRIARQPALDQMASVDSPLTELSALDPLASSAAPALSTATTSEAVGVDEDATVIGSGSCTPPPRVNTFKTPTARKQKSTGKKGPHRIMAANESNCHQCRRTTLHPKMRCRACNKNYCIWCIIKRYHDIEFHQFKKDFDCPACLDACNCTVCCDRRKEVYITTRHIKFDKETMAKLLSGEIRSLPHLSALFAGPREKLKPGQDPISSRSRKPPPIVGKERTSARRRGVSDRRDASDDDYEESDASMAPNATVRVKPVQAAQQTRRMLEESGSGRYWGAVYSLSGERIGMSYVGSNLQNVTVQATGSSSFVTKHSPSPPRQRRKRVYVGRLQDTWGFRQDTLDGSLSEDETRTNKRSRKNKEPGRAPVYYVGNQSVIRAWRKARSKTVQWPPGALLQPADGVDIHVSSPVPPTFDKACGWHEETDAAPNDSIPADGEGEDEDDRSFWIMEERVSPKKPKPSLLAATNISRFSPSNVSNILESCGHTEEELVKAVTSSLQAAGATVLIPQPPPSSLSTF